MMREADVCLLLEGTYPYVRGGVSSWVHQIVGGLQELTFAVVFVGGRRADYGEPRYELPSNVVHLETHYLEDSLKGMAPRRVRFEGPRLELVRCFHAQLRAGAAPAVAAQEACLDAMLRALDRDQGPSLEAFLYGSGSWEVMRDAYLAGHEGTAFLDYFWTLRLMHGPIFQLSRIADAAPLARVYHAVSTGFAGLLGAFLERRRERPLVLSEHGIYTKERKIDLNRADWIDAMRPRREVGLQDETASIRALWIRYFEGLGRLTYRSANPIISLYSGNQQRQHQDGADERRTRVVVNGVEVRRFASALAARTSQVPRTIGLVGRVVPIKDVKTFVRAIRVVVDAIPEVVGMVVGGAEEDPSYADECKALARALGLEANLKFLGHCNVAEIFPQLGLLMLSSISEAQPLAVLEAFASGVPCVTTDVGACREQIEGLSAEDRALGLAGRVVRFADPHALGKAAVELLSDPAEWQRCQRAALARVSTFYTLDVMLGAYRDIYRRAAKAA